MSSKITRQDIPWLRLANQRFGAFATPAEVVGWFGAVQAQDYGGAKWAVAQRINGTLRQGSGQSAPGLTSAEMDRLFNEGSILRTHVMRPTWHFVLPEDLRWLLKLTGPKVHAFNAYYYRQNEIHQELGQRVAEIFTKALLDNNFLTRDELAGELAANGIEAAGIRLALIVMQAELDGVICSGPLRGKQFTYALLDERVPSQIALDTEAALAELTRRYFLAHGPATAQDFAWWSGLSPTEVKRGLELNRDNFTSQKIDDKTYWFPPTPTLSHPVKNVKLLPNFDEFVVAYKDHTTSYDPARINGLSPTNAALLANVIALNGEVIGGWKRTFEKKTAVITLDMWTAIEQGEFELLEKIIADYGRFLEMPVRLS